MTHLLLAPFLATAIQAKSAPWITQNLAPGISVSVPVTLVASHETPIDPRISRIDDWGGKVGNHSFIASITVLNKMSVSEMSSMLSATAVQAVNRPGNSLLDASDLLLNGWSGLGLRARESSQLNLASYSYRYGRILVTVATFAPASDGQSKDTERFLHSLRLAVKGDQVVPGPHMVRFRLGTSSLSANFPCAPIRKDSPVSPSKGLGPIHSAIADYGMRSYMVTYQDVISQKKITNIAISAEVLKGFQATLGKQQPIAMGSDSGLKSTFTFGGQTIGTLVVFQHGKQVITVLEVEPRAYKNHKCVDAFLKSVRFGK